MGEIAKSSKTQYEEKIGEFKKQIIFLCPLIIYSKKRHSEPA
ncbi:hypothetical protein [Salegentibacter sp.]